MTDDRFVSIDDVDLEKLLENKDSKNTKTSIKAAVNALISYCATRNILFEYLEQMEAADLCNHLMSFYAAVRSKREIYT